MAKRMVCAVDGCGNPRKTKGYCNKHYQRVWKYGSPDICKNPIGVHGPTCAVARCDEKHHAHGYCANHAYRFKAHGDPVAGGPSPSSPGALKAWLDAHVGYSGDDCLHPPMGRKDRGYSQINADGAVVGAHAYMCEAAHGPRPEGFDLARHLCGNGHRGCVNPRHLLWGTHSENNMDKWNHGTMPHGEGQYRATLSNEQVREIRSLRGKATQVKIAEMFGVTQATVSSIQRRKAWGWLE